MSDLQSPPKPPSRFSDENIRDLQSKASIALCVACPVIIALPPRKIDFYTFGLVAIWVFSANRVSVDRTGRGILEHAVARQQWFSSGGRDSGTMALPTEKAEHVREQLRRQREEALRASSGSTAASAAAKSGLDSQQQSDEETLGVLEQLWLGDEKRDKEHWRERRLQKEREALSEGKGYSTMIMEHIADAWKELKGATRDDGSGGGDAGAGAGASSASTGSERLKGAEGSEGSKVEHTNTTVDQQSTDTTGKK